MSLIALELADTGIMAAAGNPAGLLAVDQGATSSPGFALPVKKTLSVGRAAQAQAHLYPQRVMNQFWERLDTQPLVPRSRSAGNHAEVALAHLAMVWEQIKTRGRETIITIPGFWSREQLGLLLGLARELSINVSGLIPRALAAAPRTLESGALLYLDLHLHRAEVACLLQDSQLELVDTITLDGFGLLHLHRLWAEAIAEEFVRTTRFDPLHDAASEQALYDHLPEILDRLAESPAISWEQRVGQAMHAITLTREILAVRAASFFGQLGELIGSLAGQHRTRNQAGDGGRGTILVAHGAARIPGLGACLQRAGGFAAVVLEPGAAALNALNIWDQLAPQAQGDGAYYFHRRPWAPPAPAPPSPEQESPPGPVLPTHVLYRDMAYPITRQPMFITTGAGDDARQLFFRPSPPPATEKSLCSLCREEGRIVLSTAARQRVYVDGALFTDLARLRLGQVIHLGEDGEPLRLIACVDAPREQP